MGERSCRQADESRSTQCGPVSAILSATLIPLGDFSRQREKTTALNSYNFRAQSITLVRHCGAMVSGRDPPVLASLPVAMPACRELAAHDHIAGWLHRVPTTEPDRDTQMDAAHKSSMKRARRRPQSAPRNAASYGRCRAWLLGADRVLCSSAQARCRQEKDESLTSEKQSESTRNRHHSSDTDETYTTS